MLVLGLDPSLRNYGWCLIDTEAPPIVKAKGRFHTDTKTVFIERYMYLRSEISSLCCQYPDIACVGIESPPFGELWSEGLYGLFLYAIEALHDQHKNVFFWDPSTVKSVAREFLGKEHGQMFKSDMIDAAKKATGEKRWNNDEADAFHVAHMTSRFVDFYQDRIKESELSPKEHWVFTGIKEMKKTGAIKRRGMIFKENDRFFLFGGGF